MKKIFAMTAALMMAAMSAQAQSNGYDTKHEVAISYGIDSNSQIIDAFEAIGGAMVGVRLENDRFVGPISAEYFYHAKRWLGVGGILVYGMNKQDAMLSGSKIAESKNSYYTLMPAVKFDWLRKQHFGMYSKLAIGATLRSEDYDGDTDSEVHVNWQISLVGIEAGGPTIRGFVELGMGEQGIIMGGLRYKF